ncbi:MAG: ABC transporter permease [Candidatus Hadarchaeales archaeon]
MMAGAEAIYTLWLREMKWFLRARARIAQTIFQPFLWLAIIGIGMESAFKFPGNFSYIQFLAPGVIGMSLIFSSTMGGVSILWDKQFGFMKEVLVSPVSRTHIMIGKALGTTTVSIIQGLLLVLAAGILGVWPPSIFAFLQMLLLMLLISLGFVSVGLIIASKLEDPIAFPVIVNFLIMPLFFLSGAFFPLANAPWWMKAIGYVNPLAYGVDGLRNAMLGTSEHPLGVDAGVLCLFSFCMILLGSYFFQKMKA